MFTRGRICTLFIIQLALFGIFALYEPIYRGSYEYHVGNITVTNTTQINDYGGMHLTTETISQIRCNGVPLDPNWIVVTMYNETSAQKNGQLETKRTYHTCCYLRTQYGYVTSQWIGSCPTPERMAAIISNYYGFRSSLIIIVVTFMVMFHWFCDTC